MASDTIHISLTLDAQFAMDLAEYLDDNVGMRQLERMDLVDPAADLQDREEQLEKVVSALRGQ